MARWLLNARACDLRSDPAARGSLVARASQVYRARWVSPYQGASIESLCFDRHGALLASAQDDNTLARLLLDRGVLDRATLTSCLAEVDRRRRGGAHASLAALLVERRLGDSRELTSALSATRPPAPFPTPPPTPSRTPLPADRRTAADTNIGSAVRVPRGITPGRVICGCTVPIPVAARLIAQLGINTVYTARMYRRERAFPGAADCGVPGRPPCPAP